MLLSTSRVYSIPAWPRFPCRPSGDRFISTPTAALPAGVSARRIGVDSPPRAGFALRRDQAGLRNHGAGIRRRLQFPGLDQSLRRPRRRGAVRHAGAGHLRLLDQRPPAPAAAALHRLRRQRPSGAGCLSSARSGGLLDRADARRRAPAASASTPRAAARQRHVAGAAHRLVRRSASARIARSAICDRGPSIFPGW